MNWYAARVAFQNHANLVSNTDCLPRTVILPTPALIFTLASAVLRYCLREGIVTVPNENLGPHHDDIRRLCTNSIFRSPTIKNYKCMSLTVVHAKKCV
jgi:hypothetical protein